MRALVTIKQRNEMRALRAQGHSYRELEDRFPQWTKTTIFRHVRDVPPPASGWKDGGAPRKTNYAKVARMRAQGFTYPELAERFGITVVSAWYACKVHRLENAA